MRTIPILLFYLSTVKSSMDSIQASLTPMSELECSYLLLDLTQKEILDILVGSRNAAVVVAENEEFNIVQLAKVSRCLVGVAQEHQSKSLQNLMLNIHNRQLVLISNFSNQSDIHVHNHHHPILLVNTGNHLGSASQRLACKGDAKKQIPINFFTKEAFLKYDFPVSRISWEKLCNDGNHPLKGQHMVGSVLAVKPFLYVDYETKEVKGGVAMDTLDAVAKYYGFTYHVSLSSDVFILHPNGTIGGSFGDVIFGRVDFSLEQATPMQLVYGHFTTYSYAIFSIFIESKPVRLPLYKNVVVCLDGYTWVMLGIAFLSVWIFLYLLLRKENSEEEKTNLFSVFTMTYGVIFQEYHQCKTSDKNKVSTNFRLLWILCTMFIVMAYLGNLKSSLVRKNYEERTETLNEMLDKDMKVSITSTFADYLGATITQTDFNSRLLNQAKKKDSIFPIEEDYFTQTYMFVVNGGGTSIMHQQSVQVLHNEYIRAGKDFPFVVIPQLYITMPQAIAFQTSDPRPTYFNPIIRRLQDNGITDFYFRRHMPPRGMKDQAIESEEPIIMEHLFIPLVYCASNLLMSGTVFLFELCFTCSPFLPFMGKTYKLGMSE